MTGGKGPLWTITTPDLSTISSTPDGSSALHERGDGLNRTGVRIHRRGVRLAARAPVNQYSQSTINDPPPPRQSKATQVYSVHWLVDGDCINLEKSPPSCPKGDKRADKRNPIYSWSSIN